MAQEPAEIKARIKAEGEGLKENFEEIQNRVKDALDWKIWYRNNTVLALGGAAAGGLVLSMLVGGRRASAEREYADLDFDEMDVDEEGSLAPGSRRSLRAEPKSASRLHQLADNTMSAVLGLAADKFQDFMGQALPGFREHYDAAQRRKRVG